MISVLFCVNPYASRISDYPLPLPIPINISNDINIETFISKNHGDIIERVAQVSIENDSIPLLLIAIGGDGTLNQVINGYMKTVNLRKRPKIFLSQMISGKCKYYFFRYCK